MITVHAQLIAFEKDIGGYITYVFKNLDKAPFGHNYIMCKRWPNWECCTIELNDSGFLSYETVEAGVDTWYNKETQEHVPYNFSDIVFLDFIPDKIDTSKEIIL